jgi:transposase
LRELSAHRAALVAEQTRMKNRIHSLLTQWLIRPPFAVLFSESGERWLPFDESDRTVIDGHLRLLEAVDQELARVEKCPRPKELFFRRCSTADALPGVGPACA